MDYYNGLIHIYLDLGVDGNWGSWIEWSFCPVSCGGGKSIRKRICANPAPSNGGLHCFGNQTEWKPCNLIGCSGNKVYILQLNFQSKTFFTSKM